MVRPEAVGLVALDRGDEHRNGRRAHRRRGTRRLRISRGDLLLMGAVTGVGVGVFQALVLSRSGAAGAFWWALANPLAWAHGRLVTSYVVTETPKASSRTRHGRVARLQTTDLAPPHSVWFRETEPEATRAESTDES
jgi:hypothetical protein